MQASMPKAVGEDDNLMEDSDDIPSDLDADDDSLDEQDEDDEDNDDDLVEGSDNDDLISLDGDVPDGLIEWEGSDAGEIAADEEWGGIDDDEAAGGRKRKREESSREKRKKLRSLPTFANYDDYAKMIEDGPEDDV